MSSRTTNLSYILGGLGLCFVAASVAPLSACAVDDPNTDDNTAGDGDGDGDGSGDGDGDGDGCSPNTGDGVEVGDGCVDNDDCISLVCDVGQDSPPGSGLCVEPPADCLTRAIGRLRDMDTLEPIGGAEIKIANAVAAAANPTNAEALGETTTDSSGEYDTVTNQVLGEAHPLGIIAIANKDGYYQTATGLLSQEDDSTYNPSADAHDIWVISEEKREEWNDLLVEDEDLIGYVPIGDLGGVVGIARNVGTGEPIAGVTVESAKEDSAAKLRYLNEDGTAFDGTETASSGLFLIFGPATGEEFEATYEGEVNGDAGKAGSTGGAIFTLILDLTI